MIIGEFLKEFSQSFAKVALYQSLRALIDLASFALCLIAAKKPIILECSCVLLFRLPYAFSRLLLESL